MNIYNIKCFLSASMYLIGCALALKENKEAKILEKPSVNVIGCKANSIRARKLKTVASQATIYIQHRQNIHTALS